MQAWLFLYILCSTRFCIFLHSLRRINVYINTYPAVASNQIEDHACKAKEEESHSGCKDQSTAHGKINLHINTTTTWICIHHPSPPPVSQLMLRPTNHYRHSRHRNTHTNVQRPFVRDYPGGPVSEHSPNNIHPVCHTSFINILNLLKTTIIHPSIPSSLFNLRGWQSFSATSLRVLFGLPPGLKPSNLNFFTQQGSHRRQTSQEITDILKYDVICSIIISSSEQGTVCAKEIVAKG